MATTQSSKTACPQITCHYCYKNLGCRQDSHLMETQVLEHAGAVCKQSGILLCSSWLAPAPQIPHPQEKASLAAACTAHTHETTGCQTSHSAAGGWCQETQALHLTNTKFLYSHKLIVLVWLILVHCWRKLLHNFYFPPNITSIKSRKMRSVRHVACMGEVWKCK